MPVLAEGGYLEVSSRHLFICTISEHEILQAQKAVIPAGHEASRGGSVCEQYSTAHGACSYTAFGN